MQELRTVGANIVWVDGTPVRLPGVSFFGAFKKHLMTDGWHALVEPVLDEIRRVAESAGYHGPIVLRVFRHASWWNLFGIVDPWSYSAAQAADFTSKCNAKDFIVDWTGGDYQVCFGGSTPLDGPQGIHQHHNVFTAALVGLTYIWNVSNEPFKNGLDPFAALPPPWVTGPWYSGSYDDNKDTSCVNLHTDRSEEAGAPKWVGKAHESAPYMWKHNLPVIYDEPMGAAEQDVPGSRSSVARYFRIYGTILTAVNAAYFHCEAGFTGDGMGPDFATAWPVQRICMTEYFKGVVGALLP